MEAWRKVSPRKRGDRREIFKRGEKSHSDILRRVERDNISRIRRSQKRDLIFELKKSKDVSANNLLSEVAKSLELLREAGASTLEITIIFKDIDETMTKKEFRQTLEKISALLDYTC